MEAGGEVVIVACLSHLTIRHEFGGGGGGEV